MTSEALFCFMLALHRLPGTGMSLPHSTPIALRLDAEYFRCEIDVPHV
jgi:hypothetical protein